MKIRIAGLFIAAVLLPTGAAWAQSFPAKPVKVIVPYSTGSSIDTIARQLGQRLATAWSQPVVIENQVSASGIPGTAIVAKAAPDGYTLAMVAINHAINPALYKDIPYDSVADFRPVARVASAPLVFVAHPSFPGNTLADVIVMAKAKPKELFYGSAGSGSSLQLTWELLKSKTGTDITHVPYKGVAQMLTDLLAGQVPLASPAVALAAPMVAAGKLKALAVTTARRSSLLPGVPSAAEAGIADFDVSAWSGLLAPARTPDDVVAKISGDVGRIVASKEFIELQQKSGVEPYYLNAADFTAYMGTEIAKWSKLVRDSGAKVD